LSGRLSHNTQTKEENRRKNDFSGKQDYGYNCKLYRKVFLLIILITATKRERYSKPCAGIVFRVWVLQYKCEWVLQ